MGKNDNQIIVVEKNILFNENYFNGFKNHKDLDYESVILSNLKNMRRGDAEEDPSHKQPIGYALIVNPKEKTAFAYQRSSKDHEYGEKRLQGKWSWGVGGHIDYSDNHHENPLLGSMLRELEEEIEIRGKVIGHNILGYINDDSNKVGKVHFGILYLIEVDGNVNPKDSEMAHGKLMDINELEEICSSSDCEVETWSEIALNPLKEYFNSL